MARRPTVEPRLRDANKKDLERLTVNQRLFIQCLLADPEFNATRAARKAGYKNPAGIAAKLLRNKVVSSRIGKEVAERERRAGVNKDDVLRELLYLAFINPKDFYDEDGTAIPIHELPDRAARAIKRIKAESRTTKAEDGTEETVVEYEYETWNKLGALELLGKHLLLFVEQHRHTLGASPEFLANLVETLGGKPSNVVDGSVIESKVATVRNTDLVEYDELGLPRAKRVVEERQPEKDLLGDGSVGEIVEE